MGLGMRGSSRIPSPLVDPCPLQSQGLLGPGNGNLLGCMGGEGGIPVIRSKEGEQGGRVQDQNEDRDRAC